MAVSDTHNQQEQLALPMGDMLIHAGDALTRGDFKEWEKFLSWMHRQDFKYKLFVPGNHDFWVEKNPRLCEVELENAGVQLLIDDLAVIEGRMFWGSPWIRKIGHGTTWAFEKPVHEHEEALEERFSHIGTSLDVLITHSPPFGILDWISGVGNLGSEALLKRVFNVRPRHHVFGHIHEGGGQMELVDPRGTMTFHNVAQVGFGPTYTKLCAVPATFDI